MRSKAVLAVVVGLLVAADNAKDDAKKEIKKFEGSWRLESLENDGAKTPDEELKRMKLTIEGEKYTLKTEDATVSAGTIKVDGAKKPKTINIMATDGDGSGQEMLGIYELDGDKMKVCYGRPNEERPSKLAAEAGSGRILVVAVKVKKDSKEK